MAATIRRRRLPDPWPWIPRRDTVDAETLSAALGAATFNASSPRQRERLARQIEIMSAWNDYLHAAEPEARDVGAALERFAHAASRWWGRRLDGRTLWGWIERGNARGLAALLDRRGRPCGCTALADPELLAWYARLTDAGMSRRRAHAAIRVHAGRTGQLWPAETTVRVRFAELVKRAHLARGIGRN